MDRRIKSQTQRNAPYDVGNHWAVDNLGPEDMTSLASSLIRTPSRQQQRPWIWELRSRRRDSCRGEDFVRVHRDIQGTRRRSTCEREGDRWQRVAVPPRTPPYLASSAETV